MVSHTAFGGNKEFSSSSRNEAKLQDIVDKIRRNRYSSNNKFFADSNQSVENTFLNNLSSSVNNEENRQH